MRKKKHVLLLININFLVETISNVYLRQICCFAIVIII